MVEFATRAAEIQDPIMLDLACDLALYDFADPTSKNYNATAVAEINARAEAARKLIAKKG